MSDSVDKRRIPEGTLGKAGTASGKHSSIPVNIREKAGKETSFPSSTAEEGNVSQARLVALRQPEIARLTCLLARFFRSTCSEIVNMYIIYCSFSSTRVLLGVFACTLVQQHSVSWIPAISRSGFPLQHASLLSLVAPCSVASRDSLSPCSLFNHRVPEKVFH